MNSAAQAQPDLFLELGGKRRRFVLDWNAIRRWEERFDKSFIYDIRWDRPKASDIVSVLWAALATDDPDLKYEDMDQIVRQENAKQLQPFMEQIVGRAMAYQAEDETPPTPQETAEAKKNGNGSTSSSSGA